MKRSKFSEEQVAYALRQAEAGTAVGDVCRQLGISDTTFYAWRRSTRTWASTKCVLLRREGWLVNKKRVRRLYRLEGLQLRMRVRRRKHQALNRGPAPTPTGPTERWSRGLTGVQLIISDACLGLVEAVAECYPKARWQRCVVHWYRNVFSHVPRGQLDVVARMLKAIHAQADRKAATLKAKTVVTKLTVMKLRKAATLVRETVNQTLTYSAFPSTHWRQIRTNNPLERIIREVRRRTRVVGVFPDGQSALMLVAARLRHIAATKWGTKRYLAAELLQAPRRQRSAA